MITYLVSSAADVRDARGVLEGSGRTIRGGEVVADAVATLGAGGRFVIVAHGDREGSIFLGEPGAPWLWVGMTPAPAGARVYLYSCCAGPRLSSYLTQCDCIGHSDVVPMPIGANADAVVRYLDFVDRLMGGDNFDRSNWASEIELFVGEQIELEADDESSFGAILVWCLIARSIGMST